MRGISQNNQASINRASANNFLKKVKINILSMIAGGIPMSMGLRSKIYRKLGVDVGKNCYIGKITLDKIHPEDISIGNFCTITNGVVLLTHFYDTKILTEHAYTRGKIKIGDKCYIGMNTIFTKPVKIGDGAVIGAGSIVTKNIPPYEVWAGVPARFICKRIDSSDLSYTNNFKV